MIEWTPALSVGVKALDDDHKVIIKCLQNYVKAIESDEGSLTIDSIFRELMAYTQYHFSREEAVMEACGYADLDEHKRLHKSICIDLEQYCEQYMLRPDKQLSDEVREFLRSWLYKHIYQEDFNYRDAMAGKEDLIAQTLAQANGHNG